MRDDLPAPIASYAAANARLDAEGMLASFALDAVVRDDGGLHGGHEAIRAWINSAIIAARAVFTPEAWREEDGRVIVTDPTAGDFPGSPIRPTFRFTLRGGAIAALEIG
ncbi:nuclear transport factor 2 family protein [Roseomonas nepalensis]|uniref:Nuclear transport factor 2 family protein n=1 Tax=Muricoccus nepalensis TaxID=1854500 RepID=A0A502G759_9PROT|nr:nuclear transport factor 2 family protein [Roseomonas nepalensis]TPG57825.1 nuclear transport factor 2 family protein [Roseomonas nepalensis]